MCTHIWRFFNQYAKIRPYVHQITNYSANIGRAETLIVAEFRSEEMINLSSQSSIVK